MAHQFSHYIKKYHIKSLLNLRGVHAKATWYHEEIAAAKHLQVKHYDLTMGAKGLTSIQNLRTLAHIIQTSPKPLLMHCWRGSDRTGLASAMTLILLADDVPLSKVKRQASWHYGAIASDSVGKVELHYYEAYLQRHHLQHSRKNFLQWIKQLKVGQYYPYLNEENFMTMRYKLTPLSSTLILLAIVTLLNLLIVNRLGLSVDESNLCLIWRASTMELL